MFKTASGQFELHRLPRRKYETLRAWDAADELLIDHIATELQPSETCSGLIVNDGFGALAVALHVYRPQSWSDSWLSREATRCNLKANDMALEAVTQVNSMEVPKGPFDWVAIKTPKTLALLEDELIRLRPQLKPSTRVIVGGMVKALTPAVWQLLERLVGPTTTTLARKKARLIFATVEPMSASPVNPYPVRYTLEGTDYTIANHANVFSRDSLDIGTRFFLKHLPSNERYHDIIDLGCGNGVVGLIAAERNPGAKIYFIDESYMAVASARENIERAFGGGHEAEFIVGDSLSEFAPASADLILCNPPFHQQQAVGDQIAKRMFTQAKKVLRPEGELWVIGNRHLGYHITLRKIFGGSSLIGSNKKFVILKASA